MQFLEKNKMSNSYNHKHWFTNFSSLVQNVRAKCRAHYSWVTPPQFAYWHNSYLWSILSLFFLSKVAAAFQLLVNLCAEPEVWASSAFRAERPNQTNALEFGMMRAIKTNSLCDRISSETLNSCAPRRWQRLFRRDQKPSTRAIKPP